MGTPTFMHVSLNAVRLSLAEITIRHLMIMKSHEKILMSCVTVKMPMETS